MLITRRLSLLAILIGTFSGTVTICAHDGPDPVAHWIFGERHVKQDKIHARIGPPGKIVGDYRLVDDPLGQSIQLAGSFASEIVVADDLNDAAARNILPKDRFTVAAWFSIAERQSWGSIIGTLQDNGDFEKGWLVGYNDKQFYFGLSTSGADDGDGKMTYLQGETEYQLGKLYHVVAVFDGAQMQLFCQRQAGRQQRTAIWFGTVP